MTMTIFSQDMASEIKKRHNKEPLLTNEELFLFSEHDINEIVQYLSPSLSVELQFYYHQNRIRTTKQQLEEIKNQITEFEQKYKGAYDEIVGTLTSSQIDAMNEAIDYDDWGILEQNKKALTKQLQQD